MTDAPQTIDLQQFKALAPIIEEMSIGNDFVIGEVSGKRMENSEAILKTLQYPVRFDGFIIFYLKKGHFTIDVNLNSYELRENSLMIQVPGNIIKVTKFNEERLGDAEMVFVLISKEFMSGIRFDFLKVFQDSMRLLDNPCITLDESQIALANDYFNLARKIISAPFTNKREIIGSLLTSLTYLSTDVWKQRIDEARRKTDSQHNARLNQIFERFIALVNEYHCSERGMAFYADKLCLTPKYLSKLIKQASGRSAPDWIDEFVILEAKNLLKYTNMAIKEIVFQLHFPNQSVFYKFFKAHTGMTPSEYRNG
ncbi:MAG: AraC family transcriptional regulator [Bacteroidales bacterium]|nr:AraC family transcriptional regulator [Bacteroidales bacterium]MBR1794155.1 AraC family transcriptional regulator [Bacteroidales bacterium]